jgi:mycofactocin precursor
MPRHGEPRRERYDPGMENTALTDTAEAVEIQAETLVEEELLVEEISIDGMCGVY